MRYAWGWFCRKSEPNRFGKLIIVLFVIAQILDSLFTYWGVSRVGLEAEANSLVRLVMSVMGVGPGLVLVKLSAVVFGILLYRNGIYNTIMVLTVIYLVFAICPWVYLFVTF